MEGQQTGALSGRVPLAVVVVDAAGLVSHWSSGAKRLFGISREDAVGLPASDLLPISGALGDEVDETPDDVTGAGAGVGIGFGVGFGTGADGASGNDNGGQRTPPCGGFADDDLDAPLDGETRYPSAGWARLPGSAGSARDILWWAYPLLGAGPESLLVLAADGGELALPNHRETDSPRELKESVAPTFALHTEFPGAEELARRMPEILPNMSPEQSGRIVSQALSHGYPVLEITLHRRVPVTPDWGVPRRAVRDTYDDSARRAAAPVPASTGPDESDLEDAALRERLEFLNEVSRSIGATLDLATTIKEVTGAAVPRFADFAGTHLREQVLAGESFPDGPPDVQTIMHRVLVTHNDEPGRWDDTVPVGETLAFPEHTPFFQCMTTGQPVLIPRISEELGNKIASQFEKRDLRPLINGRSLLIVPLTARRVVLGFTVLMRRADRKPFDEVDRATAAELAARAGLVLDNARLYAYQETAAETLQDSMLPQSLPRLPGVEVATRYLPGARLGKVGGDWFDTIQLPGSRVAMVVGDVMGHGINSAAMMGQLRTAVQTMASLDMPPEELLRHLDDLAQRLGEHYLATCLYAVYDPVRSELTLANAGHIPPVLVRADGRATLLDLPTGAPIGVGGVPFETRRIPVSSGDRLVMCTDGLVEVRGQDIGDGLAALCESAAHPAASMDEACDTIIRALGSGAQRRNDDVALLMARLGGIPAEHVVSWQLALDLREVRRARRLTRHTLERWGLDHLADTAELLVSEVVTNALRHAHTRHIELRLLKADALLCEVADDDHAVPVLLPTEPDREGGRGLRVVSRLAARWGASRTATGKTVWFEQHLGAARPQPSAGPIHPAG